VPQPMPDPVVTWLRSLSRTTVLVVCTALSALVITVLRLLDAPTWTQLVGALFIFALALASEADKRHTARLEKESKAQAALKAAQEKERKWLLEARSALRIWPALRSPTRTRSCLGSLRLGGSLALPTRRLPNTCQERYRQQGRRASAKPGRGPAGGGTSERSDTHGLSACTGRAHAKEGSCAPTDRRIAYRRNRA
jgi:ABC-type nickel/cobalt efflux system permease component RcnA